LVGRGRFEIDSNQKHLAMTSIVQRYIFKELIAPFVISLAFFSFVFLMTQIPLITDYVVNYQISMMTVILLLAYTMPFFLQFVIPMSVMLSVLLTFLRMSGDMEIVALKAGGVSIYRLLPPVLAFGLLGAVLTAYMAIYGLPTGRKATKQLLYEVAASHVDMGLKPRQFIDTFKDVVLYIHQIDMATKELKDVFIEDQRNAKMVSTIIAPRGRISMDSGRLIVHLRLWQGAIHQVDLGEGRANTLEFETYDIRLDMRRNLADLNQGPEHVEEMGMAKLYRAIQSASQKDATYYKPLMEWHKKFSLPAACLALSLLAMPLGIRARSSRRAYGVGLGLGFFLLYYMMLSMGWVLGESGTYPPQIGMWVPNGISLGIGWWLLVRAANERPIVLPPLPQWIKRLRFRREG
jgi:lipopolysaccharide export system permease protein